MLANNDKEIKGAYEYLKEISADDKKRMEYEAREAWLMDQRTREESAREEGMEKGIERGIEKGRIEALTENLITLLDIKFSNIPPGIKEKILKLDAGSLEKMIANIFTYEKLDDIFKYLK